MEAVMGEASGWPRLLCGVGWHLFWVCGQRMSQRWPQVETMTWKCKWDSLGRVTTWERPQEEVNALASLDIPRLFMVVVDLEFQPALSGWTNPSSWSPQECSGAGVFSLHAEYWFFSSIVYGHNASVAQVRQSSVYCLLVRHYDVPGLCQGTFLFAWGQCRVSEYFVSTNCCLCSNLEHSGITEYLLYYYCEH